MSGQKAKISALVNIGEDGLARTLAHRLWLSHADPELKRGSGESNAEAFAGLHMRSITYHSVTQQTLGIRHSNRDTFRAIHVDDYFDSYGFLTAYLAWIDSALDPEKPLQ